MHVRVFSYRSELEHSRAELRSATERRDELLKERADDAECWDEEREVRHTVASCFLLCSISARVVGGREYEQWTSSQSYDAVAVLWSPNLNGRLDHTCASFDEQHLYA